MIVNFIIDLVTVMFCPCPLFLTEKVAVQQSIRLICKWVSEWVSEWVSPKVEILISQSEHSLRLTNQSEDSILSTVSADSADQLRLIPIRAQFEIN